MSNANGPSALEAPEAPEAPEATKVAVQPDPQVRTLVEDAKRTLDALKEERKSLAGDLRVARKNKAMGVGAYLGTKAIAKKKAPTPFAIWQKAYATSDVKKTFTRNFAASIGIDVKEDEKPGVVVSKVLKKKWADLDEGEKERYKREAAAIKEKYEAEERELRSAAEAVGGA